MTPAEIKKGNTIIAVFDKWLHAKPGALKYHSDWNYLMDACKKWDNMRYDEFKDEAVNGYIDLCDELDNTVTLYEILPVFEQLVKCITWYNANVKQ